MESTASSLIPAESLVYADEQHAICMHGRLSITYSRDAPNAPSLKAWSQALDKVDGSILVMIVVDSGARAPDSAAKEEIRQTIKRHERRIAAFAYVVEGEGFAAAGVRSAVSLMSLVARHSYPERVTATVDEAAAWLCRHLPATERQSNGAALIVQAVDALRTIPRPHVAARLSR